MNRLKKLPGICAVTAVSFGLALGVHAQQATEQGQQRSAEEPSAALGGEQADQMNIYELSELEGLRVQSRDGESLGSVHSLAVDLQGENPSFIVVESGGILGIGADLKVVPIEAVEITEEDALTGQRQVVRVDIDEAQWEEIPSHEETEIAGLCDEAQAREVYQHYSIDWQETRTTQFGGREREQKSQTQSHTQSEETEAKQQEFGSPDAGAREEENDPQNDEKAQSQQQPGATDQAQAGQPAGTSDLEQQSAAQQQSGVQQEQESQIEEREETSYGAREQRQTATTDRQREVTTTERQQTTQQCELVLTKNLKGQTIHNAQQTEVGSIEDIIFDMNAGQVQYVLIAPESGLLEGSDEMYAIAPRSFRTITSEEVVLETTREQLQQAEVLTETTIRESTRQDSTLRQETQDQPQIFRYEREEITFGRPERESADEEQDQSTRQQEATESEEQTTSPGAQESERRGPPPHAQDPERRGPPPHAQDPERRGPPPHAQGREFGSPDDQRRESGQQSDQTANPEEADEDEESDSQAKERKSSSENNTTR